MQPDADEPVAPEINRDTFFKIIRAYRIKEHGLLNHRMTWTLTIQGFLFATYGFSIQVLAQIQSQALVTAYGKDLKDANITTSEYSTFLSHVRFSDLARLQDLTKAIPWLGIGVASCVLLAVIGANLSLWSIGRRWRENERKYPKVAYPISPLGGGNPGAVFLGLFPPLLIPCAFIFAWRWLLLHS